MATDSPPLMAYRGELLYQLEGSKVVRLAFDELEHVKVMREFLAAPEAFTRRL